MKDVLIRFISGALYVSLIFFSLQAGREWFIGLLFIFAIITLKEFVRLIDLKAYIANLILAISFYFVSYKNTEPIITFSILAITLIVNLYLLKNVIIFNKLSLLKKRRYFFIFFYVITGFLFLSLIPYIGNNYKPNIILGIFILAWSNDTFAYLVGKRFGKRKLKSKISPKKTVEGFLGGIVGAIIISFFIFKYADTSFSLNIWLFLAILVSVMGTIGDLIQSKFKRLADVKDSGKIMPGHGGLYDRLDSIIFVSPFIYAFLILTKYVS